MTIPLDEAPGVATSVNGAQTNGNGADGAGSATAFETLFGFPIVNPVRWSQTLSTAIQVEGPAGEVIRWERQMDLATPKLLVMPVASAGLYPRGRKLPKPELAVEIYGELVGCCEAVEDAEHAGEAAAWGQAVLNATVEIVDISTFDAVQVWTAWRAVQVAAHMGRELASWMPPAVADGRFEYIRQCDVAAWVRQVERHSITDADLKARMGEAGWRFHFVQMWQPDVPRADAIRAIARTFRRALGA